MGDGSIHKFLICFQDTYIVNKFLIDFQDTYIVTDCLINERPKIVFIK